MSPSHALWGSMMSNNNDEQPFIAAPHYPTLKSGPYQLMMHLVAHVGPDGDVTRSKAALAQDLGWHPSTLRAHLLTLERENLIRRVRRGRPKTSIIRLLFSHVRMSAWSADLPNDRQILSGHSGSAQNLAHCLSERPLNSQRSLEEPQAIRAPAPVKTLASSTPSSPQGDEPKSDEDVVVQLVKDARRRGLSLSEASRALQGPPRYLQYWEVDRVMQQAEKAARISERDGRYYDSDWR